MKDKYKWQMFFTIGGEDYTLASRIGYGDTHAEASKRAWEAIVHTYPIPEQWKMRVVGDIVSKHDGIDYVEELWQGTIKRGE